MDGSRTRRIAALDQEIALLQLEEKRLQSLISSIHTNTRRRVQAQHDLKVVLETLYLAAEEIARLRKSL
jgi:hypothetical protein